MNDSANDCLLNCEGPKSAEEAPGLTRKRLLPHQQLLMDENTKATLQKIPLLTVRAGPRDGELWVQRLKEEYTALIQYVKNNKEAGNDWFQIESNKMGTRWTGKCWYVHDFKKYEFELQFEIPVTYPNTPFEMLLPELEGKTVKMYRGGKICLTQHFKPLWAKNVPHFGIAHALAMGLAPWLAAEIPFLIREGLVKHKEDVVAPAEEKK